MEIEVAQDFFFVEGLDQIAAGTQLKHLLDDLAVGIGRAEQDLGGPLEIGVLHEPDTVFTRHAVIGHDDVEIGLGHFRHGLLGIVDRMHLMLVLFEHLAQGLEQAMIVIHNQDTHFLVLGSHDRPPHDVASRPRSLA